MKVMFRQDKIYGCTHYALANFFNEPKVLEFIREGYGSHLEDLNEVLRELQPGYYFSSLVCLLSELPVQNRFIDIGVFNTRDIEERFKSGYFRPFICTIRKGSLHHAILVVQDLGKNILHIFDSLKEEVQSFTYQQFVLNYWVVELAVLNNEITRESCRVDCEPLSLFFEFDDFPHLKP